jgi:hypothetical protein
MTSIIITIVVILILLRNLPHPVLPPSSFSLLPVLPVASSPARHPALLLALLHIPRLLPLMGARRVAVAADVSSLPPLPLPPPPRAHRILRRPSKVLPQRANVVSKVLLAATSSHLGRRLQAPTSVQGSPSRSLVGRLLLTPPQPPLHL